MSDLHPIGCTCRDCRPVGPGIAPPWHKIAWDIFYIALTAAGLWGLIYLVIRTINIWETSS